MNDVYILVTCRDTVFDDSYKDVSAIFATRQDALDYLQKIYERCSKEANEINEDRDNDEYVECWMRNDEVVHYRSDWEATTYKIVNVQMGVEFDVWKL